MRMDIRIFHKIYKYKVQQRKTCILSYLFEITSVRSLLVDFKGFTK